MFIVLSLYGHFLFIAETLVLIVLFIKTTYANANLITFRIIGVLIL